MHALLRSVWDEPRPAGAPTRVWRDWLLVGVLAPLAVIEGFSRPDLPWRAVWVPVFVALLPTLLWRRGRPLPMLAVAFAGTGVISLLVGSESQLVTAAWLLLLPYALFRWGSGRDMVIGTAIMLGRLLITLALIGPDRPWRRGGRAGRAVRRARPGWRAAVPVRRARPRTGPGQAAGT